MKVGKRTHIDLGALAGLLVALVGALPEILANPAVKAAVPPKYANILVVLGVAIAAMRGRAVRVEQYREADVVAAAVTGELPATVDVTALPTLPVELGEKDERVERPTFKPIL